MTPRPLTQAAPLALDDAAATVAARFEDVFTAIQPLREAVEAQLAAGPGRVRSTDLRVEPHAAAVLRAPGGMATAAGYVPAPHVLADRSTWLEWWTVGEPGSDGPLERVEPETAPDGTPTYDYSSTPWMVVPRETGERHVTGPYVDLFCTKEYALTLTVPVSAAGAFGGVVGVDLLVAELERRIAGLLAAVEAPVALVNASGRVVTTVDFGLLTGDLVRDAPFAELWAGSAVAGHALERCGELPLGLLSRASRSTRPASTG